VGRPVARSRTNNGADESFGGTGALWSTKHATATLAPTRLSITCTTSSTRSRPPTVAVTRSPIFTGVAAFADEPFTLMCPPPQASVAAVRVGYRRTAHAHLSTLVLSTRGTIAHGHREDEALGAICAGVAVGRVGILPVLVVVAVGLPASMLALSRDRVRRLSPTATVIGSVIGGVIGSVSGTGAPAAARTT